MTETKRSRRSKTKKGFLNESLHLHNYNRLGSSGNSNHSNEGIVAMKKKCPVCKHPVENPKDKYCLNCQSLGLD
jgi:hypothetical protein